MAKLIEPVLNAATRGALEEAKASRSSWLQKDDPPIGTWFYKRQEDDLYELWQQTENGPKRVGFIYNHPSIDFICEKLNSR